MPPWMSNTIAVRARGPRLVRDTFFCQNGRWAADFVSVGTRVLSFARTLDPAMEIFEDYGKEIVCFYLY